MHSSLLKEDIDALVKFAQENSELSAKLLADPREETVEEFARRLSAQKRLVKIITVRLRIGDDYKISIITA